MPLSFNDQLNQARLAINNARNTPAIQTALAALGYDEVYLQNAQALLAQVEALADAQLAGYGDKRAATQAVKVAQATAHEVYKQTLRVARVAFQHDTQAALTLLLAGPRQRQRAAWLRQTTTFYNNLLDDEALSARMAQFGYTAARLGEERALVEEVARLDEVQKQEMGAAQAATEARNARLGDLQQWMRDFRVIARVALAQNPQLLEALGFKA